MSHPVCTTFPDCLPTLGTYSFCLQTSGGERTPKPNSFLLGFLHFPGITMIAGPVQSYSVIHSHSDVLTGRIPKATTVLPYTWVPILPTFFHTHMCDFGTKKLAQVDFWPSYTWIRSGHPHVLLGHILGFANHRALLPLGNVPLWDHWRIFLLTDLRRGHASTTDRGPNHVTLRKEDTSKISVLSGGHWIPFPRWPAEITQASWEK